MTTFEYYSKYLEFYPGTVLIPCCTYYTKENAPDLVNQNEERWMHKWIPDDLIVSYKIAILKYKNENAEKYYFYNPDGTIYRTETIEFHKLPWSEMEKSFTITVKNNKGQLQSYRRSSGMILPAIMHSKNYCKLVKLNNKELYVDPFSNVMDENGKIQNLMDFTEEQQKTLMNATPPVYEVFCNNKLHCQEYFGDSAARFFMNPALNEYFIHGIKTDKDTIEKCGFEFKSEFVIPPIYSM